MSNPYPHWIDKAEEELTKSYQEGTINDAFIGNVMDAAKAAAIQEVKNLNDELAMCNHQLGVAHGDLEWYRKQHPVLLDKLSMTGQALAAKQNELLSTTGILSATLQVVGGTGATVPKGKYDELEKKYIETRAALEMITYDNGILKRQHEEDQAELRKFRRENERLNKKVRLADAPAKELEGTSSNP